MEEYKDLLNKFENVKNKVRSLIDQYPQNKRLGILFDKWSLKDVVAHLNHWMVHDIDCLDHLMRGKEPYWHPNKDEFNKEGVEFRKNRSWEEIYNEFNMLVDKLISIYRNLPKRLQNKKIWKGYNGTPLRFLLDDIRHWEGEHIPSLESNLK